MFPRDDSYLLINLINLPQLGIYLLPVHLGNAVSLKKNRLDLCVILIN